MASPHREKEVEFSFAPMLGGSPTYNFDMADQQSCHDRKGTTFPMKADKQVMMEARGGKREWLGAHGSEIQRIDEF